MAQTLLPPSPLPEVFAAPAIFLAGSIAQGQAALWQDHLIAALADLDVWVLNPRRAAWDATWDQRADYGPFREQVEWELNAIRRSDLLAFYFDPATPSPVSMLELGLVAGSGKRAIVLCPDGFWRKGNIDIVCDQYGISRASSWDDFVAQIRDELSDASSADLSAVDPEDAGDTND